MSAETGNGASAAPAPRLGGGPRIHRAAKAQVAGPRRILVVDDNKVILRTTASKLKANGYEVLTAEDGGSAIRQVRQLQPHLILLDLNFPPDVGHGGGVPWDGLLILTWLRRTVEVQKIPVIIITGGDLEKYQSRFAEAGVLDIFLKPIDHDALLAAIRWALNEEVAGQDSTPMEPANQPLSEPSPEPGSGAGRKVLFIDDTSDWRYLAASCAGERGFEVVTAEDPVSAMLQVSQSKPNIVVLDMNLAGHSAATLLKVLCELHPKLPILVYSETELDDAQVSELRARGAWDWLPKGNPQELVTAIEKTIGGPRTATPRRAAPPAEQNGAETPPATVASNGSSAAAKADPAPSRGRASSPPPPPAHHHQRRTPKEALSNGHGTARNQTAAPTHAMPEAPVVVPEAPSAAEAEVKSILIVDDDTALAETVRAFLESRSFRVCAVTNGAEAMRVIAAAEVDLILFDLTLPGLPVSRFYEEVKAIKPHLCPRIIFMTSDDSHPADDGFVRRLKGVSIWKPYPMDWLLEAVQAILAGTQQRQLAGR